MGKFQCYLWGLGLAIFSLGAQAADNQAEFELTATVAPACSVSAAPLAFRTYNPDLGRADYATTTISVLCTKDTNFLISIDNGAAGGAGINNRKMHDKSGTNHLNYFLYRDKTFRTVWGDRGDNSLPGVGTGEQQLFVIYAKITEHQHPPAGIYNDNLNLTLKLGNSAGILLSQSAVLSYQLSVPLQVLARIESHTPGTKQP